MNGTAAGRLTGSLLTGVLMVVSVAACTGGAEPDPRPSEPAAVGPTTAPSPVGPPSVPMRVEVTHVAGKLGEARRRTLARTVRRTLSAYVDAAFLAGDYPRSSFDGSFGVFTRGAARQGRGDLALLTNQRLGATTRSVRATRRTAYLSVLAPRQRAAGVTAAVHLVFVVDRLRGPAQRVEVRGRLLLTRVDSGAWRIFGYDVTRSQRGAS